MPQYQVLHPIEHNGRLYLPAGHEAADTTRSAGNGSTIPADTTGVIELTPAETAALTGQQLRAITVKPAYGPTPIPELRAATESTVPPAAAAKATPDPGSSPAPDANPVAKPVKPAGPAKGK